MTQTEQVLKHIELYGSITPLEAMQEYGIMRLASRIADLKRNGTPIKSKIVSAPNRNGEPTHFSMYYMGG